MTFVLALLLWNNVFIVDASTEASYTVELSRDALRGYVDDIGLFRRNMPGVVSVEPLGEDTYLYRTEKEIPLSGRLYTDFTIQKSTIGDSVTWYRSVSIEDPNYMSCRVTITPESVESSSIRITLRLRLSRTNPSEIHWLAPVLGEDFISERMEADMSDMLEEFINRSNSELYTRLLGRASEK